MRWNRVVELGRESTESRQPGPSNGWEIMMLVVIANLSGGSCFSMVHGYA